MDEMESLKRHVADLFSAIVACYQQEWLMPCLVLLYSGMDAAASLESSVSPQVGVRFPRWVDQYVLRGKSFNCDGTDLYGARCGVIHTFSPDSTLSCKQQARLVAYAFGKATVEQLDQATAKAGRQSIQVNVHMGDLIEAFHGGFMAYLEETRKDPVRWKEVKTNFQNWLNCVSPGLIDAYVEL